MRVHSTENLKVFYSSGKSWYWVEKDRADRPRPTPDVEDDCTLSPRPNVFRGEGRRRLRVGAYGSIRKENSKNEAFIGVYLQVRHVVRKGVFSDIPVVC